MAFTRDEHWYSVCALGHIQAGKHPRCASPVCSAVPDHRPSVTTILSALAKPALVPWAAKMEREAAAEAALELLTMPGAVWTPEGFHDAFAAALKGQRAAQKAKDDAANIGKTVHRLIEADLHALLRGVGESVEDDEAVCGGPVATAYQHWLTWREDHALTPLRMETMVASREHGYAGTVDLVAAIDDKKTVVDFKTGNRLYPEARLQLAAYFHALEEQEGEGIDRGLLLRLPKTAEGGLPEALWLSREELWEGVRSFLAVKDVWTWMRAQEENF